MIQVRRWFVAIALYLFLVLAALAFRPALMFDQSGRPKPCGLGLKDGNSMFAPCIAFPLMAIISYFVATLTYVVLV